jgi:hypothetical protein
MIHRALFIAVTILAALPGMSSAQTPDTTRIAAAKQMMEVAGSAAQFDQVMPLMSQQMSQAFKNLAPGSATEIDDVFRQLVPKFIERKGELLDQIATLYATEMTLDELNAIVAFYKSPVGAKFASVQPKILRDSMALGQRWGQKIGEELADEVRRELKKRGIDL